MSELPVCKLCGSGALTLGEGEHQTVVCGAIPRWKCAITGQMTPEQWRTLMGGELVGYVFRRTICSDHDPADCEEYDDFVRLNDIDADELAEYEKHGMVMAVYSSPADDGVLRDAARYRWLRDRARTSEMDTHGIYIGVDSDKHKGRWALFEDRADKAIDAAMKGA